MTKSLTCVPLSQDYARTLEDAFQKSRDLAPILMPIISASGAFSQALYNAQKVTSDHRLEEAKSMVAKLASNLTQYKSMGGSIVSAPQQTWVPVQEAPKEVPCAMQASAPQHNYAAPVGLVSATGGHHVAPVAPAAPMNPYLPTASFMNSNAPRELMPEHFMTNKRQFNQM